MLSQATVVKVRSALERGYIGTMDVYEQTQTTGSNHVQVMTESQVLNDIPCRLSFSQSPVVTGGDASQVAQTVKVFFAPEYTIAAGSKIVITQNSVTETYKHTGKEAVYDTHKEVELELFDRWS